MKVGLLIIGSEVLNGKITDLNTRFLAEFLRRNSLELTSTITVKDEETAIFEALDLLVKTTDVIVTSGGLGPTLDDITKSTLAKFLGRKINYSLESHKIAEENYSRFNRVFPGKEHGYAQLPEGFVALSNSTGFAPAFYAQHFDKFIISAPGVPREFTSIIKDHFLKIVAPKMNVPRFMEMLTFRTARVPEEKIFTEIDPTLWEKLSTLGDVSSLPIIMGVDICVTLRANSQNELEDKKLKVHEIFDNSPVSKIIWHRGPEHLEDLIVIRASKKNIKFGFAESCTGGLCSHRITSVSGSSAVFMGSVVCYNESVKEGILKVKSETLKKFGAVSSETAAEMSQGLLEELGLDIAISATGFAGPTGGTPENPVGTVWIGVSVKGKTATQSFQFLGDREIVKTRFSQIALMTLLEEVEKFA